MLSLIRKRMRGDKGFTLIELLVVIIIIAILAAIAIPTFLGQRQKAQDAAAKSLVRNAMTAVESAYVDQRSFATITDVMCEAIEPSIDFLLGAAGTTAAAAPAAAALAATHIVEYTAPAGGAVYALGTWSESGTEWGVLVNKGPAAGGIASGNTYYKGGAVVTNW